MTGVYADGAVRKIGCSSTSSVFADDFDRPDDASSLGSPWVAYVGTWGATGGAAHLATGSVQAIAAVETGVSDCTVAVNISSAFPQGGGLSWRVVDGSNCWFWDYDSSGAGATPGSSVYKYVGGTLTQVLTGLPPTSTHRISVELNGSSHTLKIDGSTVATFSDSAHQTATEHGLRDFGAQAVLDNFEVTVPTSGLLKGYFDGRIWREICAGDTTSNVMLTVDHATYNSWLSPVVYDGDRLSANWTGMGFGTNYWVIDLGAVTFIDHVNWLLYYADPRTYTNIGLEAAVGFGPWTTIRSPATYQPSLDGSAGLDIPVGGSFRYLRFYSEGNSVNFNNEWVEVEVWAGPERRPIKVYDGTTTRTICMTPV